MTEYVDFDLELLAYGENAFTAVARRTHPGDKTPKRLEVTKPLAFDFNQLDQARGDPKEYGRILTRQLFEAEELRDELIKAFQAAADAEKRSSERVRVRFRLSISQKAPRLHSLRWETLRDPTDETMSLLTNRDIAFSRHVYTSRGKGVRDRKPVEMKALVVVAAPADLAFVTKSGYAPLAPIRYEPEVAAAKKRLAGFDITFLAEQGAANIDRIFKTLGEGEYYVLYLVCHGAPGERPRLVLEDESGNRDLVDAAEVVTRMRELEQPPTLVVLASCRSGGATYTTSGEAVSRLGPDLAIKAGIPVVLAMQGDVTIDTASKFLETFFENVRSDGDIDHAATVARRDVSEQPDAWMPVLYMRLADGRLWSKATSMSAASSHSFEKWQSLIGNISRGKCTPILGFGVYEEMFGDAASLARFWGETYRYPLNEDDDLPEIAQYLAIKQDTQFPRDELIAHFRREVLRRYRKHISVDKHDQLSTDELITQAWHAAADSRDPHRVLANLPCSLYLTANVSSILETALKDAAVTPQSGLCRWNNSFRAPALPTELDFEKPLVYHLFGHLHEETSIVLTEDNYFDYLVATADGLQPDPMIRGRAKSTSVILLGFRITDWTLRVLFRTLLKERQEDETFTHVAVQVDPDQPGGADPERVYAYLDSYFARQEITIFRGTVSEFTNELVKQWDERFHEDLTAKRAKVRPR